MEDLRIIEKCDFCGHTKEVVKLESGKHICADCIFELQELPNSTFNAKDLMQCQTHALAATAL
jgi:hypothetical protein